MRYNSPSKQKFTLFGWTMGWIEWAILIALVAYGFWNRHDFVETKPDSAAVSVEDVASVIGFTDDGQDKAVDIWLMKFQLDFDRMEKEFSESRDLRYFNKTLLKKCLIETASANGQLLPTSYVVACQKKAELEAIDALEYWKKK